MKKVKHKRKVGEVVDFIFFDGSKKTGKIVELTYHGDNIDSVRTQYDLPTYRIHVPDKKYSRGYMVYSSMTDIRIEDAKTKERTLLLLDLSNIFKVATVFCFRSLPRSLSDP